MTVFINIPLIHSQKDFFGFFMNVKVCLMHLHWKLNLGNKVEGRSFFGWCYYELELSVKVNVGDKCAFLWEKFFRDSNLEFLNFIKFLKFFNLKFKILIFLKNRRTLWPCSKFLYHKILLKIQNYSQKYLLNIFNNI